ncbi:Sodium/potassium-transporting ATPase subunit alpha [Xyrichtys novacula]|uniref:Sodium/potassium-transporting ATPase subunit alpha n=1 Tax=Xyrichtys novacula TaxID=13765 RepID=A0AAV1HHN0_XYRNO|nr:Sodium/potassium-transporting ATPase subunit alpha [Xyrichtys novacula]
MSECDHEEADTRVCVHLKDALEKGSQKVVIRTVDTDIIVILVGLLGQLTKDYPDTGIWVAFGMGKNFQEICINTISQKIGKSISLALPAFHAFTGCDTTSQFRGKGKKSAWAAWKSFPEVTNAFIAMAAEPHQLSQESKTFALLERYTCVLYDKTTNIENVNDLRKDLFAKKSLSMENIPPT